MSMTTMTSTPSMGGKRKVNKGLKDWVTFVKKVQKEEGCSYKDAIHKAKVRKDKGEKWMTGGSDEGDEEPIEKTAVDDALVSPSVPRSACRDRRPASGGR